MNKHLKTFGLAAVAALALSACGGGSDSGSGYTAHPYDAPAISEADKNAYLGAINNARSTGRSCGEWGYFPAAPAFVWDDALYLGSYEHADDLLISGTYSHDGSNTASDWTAQVQELGRASDITDRAKNNGWVPGDSSDTGVSENVVAGRNSIDAAVSAWLGSPGHCAGVMSIYETKIGLARVENMWVMLTTVN